MNQTVFFPLLILFFILSSQSQAFSSKIKIIYTSALIPDKFQERKQEYIKSLEIIKKLGYINDTYVVESGFKSDKSFFELYCPNIFYSGTNDTTIKKVKSVNEARALISAFKHFSFDDEDFLVKITGRYLFNKDSIFQFLQSHHGVDAVVSWRSNEKKIFQTGCFVLRGKYFKDWLNQIDLVKMKIIECELTDYIEKMRSNGAKIVILDKIGISANPGNSGMVQW